MEHGATISLASIRKQLLTLRQLGLITPTQDLTAKTEGYQDMRRRLDLQIEEEEGSIAGHTLRRRRRSIKKEDKGKTGMEPILCDLLYNCYNNLVAKHY